MSQYTIKGAFEVWADHLPSEGYQLLCGIIRYNGTMSHNAMSEAQRAEQAFDLHAECCMGRTRRKPHRTPHASTTAVFQPSTRAVTRRELEALGFV